MSQFCFLCMHRCERTHCSRSWLILLATAVEVDAMIQWQRCTARAQQVLCIKWRSSRGHELDDRLLTPVSRPN